jgi:hypothetical protein
MANKIKYVNKALDTVCLFLQIGDLQSAVNAFDKHYSNMAPKQKAEFLAQQFKPCVTEGIKYLFEMKRDNEAIMLAKKCKYQDSEITEIFAEVRRNTSK